MSEGTTPTRRLIEEAFPLKKVSEDSKHEKTVRHGHISTLHIWPARRPLAAARATAIAALLPDPGDEAARAALCQRIESLTRWGSENGPELQKFRDEIRAAYGGRAPRVLDMFAGGGAIPFEAMRLGCDVTAIDYNPVAWLLLRCTLEYPQRFAGKTWPIPPELEHYLEPAESASKSAGKRGSASAARTNGEKNVQPSLLQEDRPGNLADHVRAWGGWVLDHARQELAPFYPAVGGKTPLTYLWARTVPCPDPNCGTAVPLLKSLWLSTKQGSRVALRIVSDKGSGPVHYEIWKPGPKEEADSPVMTIAQATCPRCNTQLPTEYLRKVGQQGHMGSQMIAVVVQGQNNKEYRLCSQEDLAAVQAATEHLAQIEKLIPFGRLSEPISPAYLSSRHQAAIIVGYGLNFYNQIFTERAQMALLTFVNLTRQAQIAMEKAGYSQAAAEAICSYLALMIDRVADYVSNLAHWVPILQKIAHALTSYRFAMSWDFSEVNPLEKTSGGYPGQIDWVAKFIEHALEAACDQLPKVSLGSAINLSAQETYDAIITDPPYYDAIPYADLSDFFYIWLKRTLNGNYGNVFGSEIVPKEGELIQNAGLFNKDEQAARQNYETGMAKAFARAQKALRPDGLMVIVFAHKDVQAWETLVNAMIDSGWTVTASWPIDTEMNSGMRVLKASLASSIWLVCRKRPEDAGAGRYSDVMRRMQERVTERLRTFWDSGISGPDFIWAAVGPALESYSSYREVRRLDGTRFTVGEFLREVRRLVTDFALGKMLHGASTGALDETTRYYLMHRSSFKLGPAPMGECILLAGGYGLNLDDLRGPRGILAKGGPVRKAAPAESDDDPETDDASDDPEPKKMSGNDLRLLTFDERTGARVPPATVPARGGAVLGEPLPNGTLPMIDMLHRLMAYWSAGQSDALADYTTAHSLGPENDVFWAMAQSILEMSDPKTRERTLLEALVTWGRKRAAAPETVPVQMHLTEEEA